MSRDAPIQKTDIRGAFCMEFAHHSSCAYMGFHRVLQLPPMFQRHARMLVENSTFFIGVSVNGCLIIYVDPGMDSRFGKLMAGLGQG